MTEPKKRPPRKAKKPSESKALPTSFDVVGRTALRTHQRVLGLGGGWTVEGVVAARDLQCRGLFRQAVRLIRSAKTEPSIFAALLNRIAPHRGLPRAITCSEVLTGSSEVIRCEAEDTFCSDGVAISPGVLTDVFEGLAMSGLYVCQNVWTTREDGSRDDVAMVPFPLEFVEWSEPDRCLYAWTVEGRIPIVHGDGRWVVFAASESEPWSNGAIVALANLWVEQRYARSDRLLNSESHGDAKWIGTLPEGVPIDSQEGRDLLAEMERLYEPRRAMLKPFGSEVERVEAVSQMYQIFPSILDSNGKDAQRVLLGQDGTMTNAGGNYIKALTLFSVRMDLVEADLSCVGRGLSTGVLRPWSIRNFARYDGLQYSWLMPDPDQDARRESIAKQVDAFNKAVKEYRENGFVIDQALVDRLAKSYGVDAPTLATSVGDATAATPGTNPAGSGTGLAA